MADQNNAESGERRPSEAELPDSLATATDSEKATAEQIAEVMGMDVDDVQAAVDEAVPRTNEEPNQELVARCTDFETPGVETIGAGGGSRDDPAIPCHDCGDEERFTTIKRSDDWQMEYREDGTWGAFCPDCGGATPDGE